jgi:hypothetical protein
MQIIPQITKVKGELQDALAMHISNTDLCMFFVIPEIALNKSSKSITLKLIEGDMPEQVTNKLPETFGKEVLFNIQLLVNVFTLVLLLYH